MTDEGVKLFGEYADKEMFVIPKDKLPQGFEVKDFIHKALNCFSPLSLRVPTGWYAEMLTHKCDKFTLTHMNLLKQILLQATGRAMNVQPRQFAAYIMAMDIIFYEFLQIWNAAIEKFESEYPAPVEEAKQETNIIDISKAVQGAVKVPAEA